MKNEKEKTFFYKNGLPFNGRMNVNIDAQRNRVMTKEKCSMIVVDGIPGEGKTTMGIHVLEYFQKHKIIYGDQYGMGFSQFNKKLRISIKNGLHVVIYDEAGDYNKRGWASAINRHLNRIFEIYRKFRILIIMIMPSFHKLDSDLLVTGVPRHLIHCYGRTDTFGCFKGYGLWRMTHVKKKMDDRRVACKHEVYNWVSPNHRGNFKDLPPKRAEELDIISSQGKSDILEEIEIQNDGLMDYHKISVNIDRSVDWVKRKVSQLRISPVKIYNRKKYFEKTIIGELQAHLGDVK